MIKTVREAGNKIPHRTISGIMHSLVSEVGELAVEVSIKEGTSYKKPDADGIIGESVDVILCALDMILSVNPNITEEELLAIARIKCDKWVDKTLEHLKNKS